MKRETTTPSVKPAGVPSTVHVRQRDSRIEFYCVAESRWVLTSEYIPARLQVGLSRKDKMLILEWNAEHQPQEQEAQ